MKTAVITGTSTGIGLAATMHLARNGYRVFAGMRNLSKGDALREAAAQDDLPIEVIEMDVCDSESVSSAFAEIAAAGPVDVLVNNAGVSGSSPLETTPEHEHKLIFETNYFGTVRCIQAVVGSMRERETGCIVNISSAAGLFATPTQIPYSASKWAVECMGEALAHELLRFGVRVVNIEPGVVLTNIFENAAEQSHYQKISPYGPVMRRIGRIFAAGLKQPTHADAVAEKIIEAITAKEYRFRWPIGADAIGFYEARDKVSAEEWIGLGCESSDDEYNTKFHDFFNISL